MSATPNPGNDAVGAFLDLVGKGVKLLQAVTPPAPTPAAAPTPPAPEAPFRLQDCLAKDCDGTFRVRLTRKATGRLVDPGGFAVACSKCGRIHDAEMIITLRQQ